MSTMLFAGSCRLRGFASDSGCVCVDVCGRVCVCVCVFCPAAQRRVIQMCVCELYALDKSTLSPALGPHHPIPNNQPHVVCIFLIYLYIFHGAHCDI